MENTFCFCGRVATRQIGKHYFCDKHDKIKVKPIKIGRYRGHSKTPFGKYEER